MTRIKILQKPLTGECLKATVVLLQSDEGPELRAPGEPPIEVVREKIIILRGEATEASHSEDENEISEEM